MDMKIAGSGSIAPGEYRDIHLSGSAKLSGHIICQSLHASGAAKGESIECENDFKASGSCKFDGDIKAGSISASGAFSCGSAEVRDAIRCSGSSSFGGDIRCTELKSAGVIRCAGNIEAETLKASGVINCGGLMNAESIDIRFCRDMTIGSIGGSNIYIRYENTNTDLFRRLLSYIKGSPVTAKVTVNSGIEGDTIDIEYTSAGQVSGRNVKIGSGCEIDSVQYSESIEIADNALVGKVEKI